MRDKSSRLKGIWLAWFEVKKIARDYFKDSKEDQNARMIKRNAGPPL